MASMYEWETACYPLCLSKNTHTFQVTSISEVITQLFTWNYYLLVDITIVKTTLNKHWIWKHLQSVKQYLIVLID